MASPGTLGVMRTVLVAPQPEWLTDRRRRGADAHDEVWDGVLHVPPEPTSDHQRFEGRLEHVLFPLAERRGLESFRQLALLDPRNHDKNYRVPDIVIVEPRHVLRRGSEGPIVLAIEVLSPDDECRDKLPFYAERGVAEVWLVDPETRGIEVYLLRGATYFTTVADRAGVIRAPALDLELSVIDGPRLRVAWADGAAEI